MEQLQHAKNMLAETKAQFASQGSSGSITQKDVDAWAAKVAQYEQHAIANSPAASALLKSDPRAYINTFGSAVDRQNINTTLPPATPPGSAGAITTGINTPQIPTTTPTAGNISGASAGTASLGTFFDTLVKQNADNEKARADAEKARQTENQSLLQKLMSSTTSPSAARTAAQAETGITPANYFAEEKAKIEEIGKLTEEYNAVKAARDAQIAGTQDKLASMNFINNQTAQIERNAAPRLNELSANINSKAAVLQALQGRFNEAQTYVNQAVQDATANTKYQMDLFNTFYQINQDSIDRLDTIYQDAFKTKMSLATTAYEQDVKSKTEIGKLMIDPAYRGAGISITDTLDQALAKAQSVAGKNYLADKATSGGGGTGLTPYQLTQVKNQIQDNARQDPNISTFAPVRASYETARAAANTGNSAGDIVLMRMLAKITDPTTGVREEEYRTFESAIGTLPAYGVALTSNMIGSGKLTEAGRKALLAQVENVYNQREAAYNNSVDYYEKQAKDYNLGAPVPKYVAPPSTTKSTNEQIFNSVVEETPKSSNWIVNLWNKIF